MAKYFFLKFGNPLGIKTICEFALNWYLRAALAKNSGTLCVNSAIPCVFTEFHNLGQNILGQC